MKKGLFIMNMIYRLTDKKGNKMNVNSRSVDGWDGNGNFIVNGCILEIQETKQEVQKQFSDWFKELIKKQ